MFKIFFFVMTFSSFLSFAQSTELQKGKASYYGTKFDGKTTANGEIFDMNKFTAAHPKLPFNTMVRVTNVQNNKSVVVRINDRGPFSKYRIIDLSKAAAEQIGMIEKGIVTVTIEVLDSFSIESIYPNQ